jgi:hypothetical protein
MPVDPDIVLKAGDTAPIVEGVLKDAANKIVPLQVGDTVTFRLRPVGMDAPAAFSHAAVVVGDGTAGKVEYHWAVGETDVVGMYEADFHVAFADGVRKGSFPNGRSLTVQIKPAP